MPVAATHAHALGSPRPEDLPPPPADPPRRAVHVAVIVPCHDRPRDAAAILSDLAALETDNIHPHVLLVDNASAQPLSGLAAPPGLALEHIRLDSNTGGSGGFNAGISRALALDDAPDAPRPDYLWLVDSDARVAPETLTALTSVLESDPTVVAAGAAIHDPKTGRCFEVGGLVDRRTGRFRPAVAGKVGVRALVECDYTASCCALVRASAVRAAGPLPDRFINADDVEWFIRLAQTTGGRVVAVPRARAWHPRFGRFPTWQRYYTTRNALAPLAAMGLGRPVRFRRAVHDACRAAYLEIVQRPDLATLHIAGLRDAAAGRITGPAPDALARVDQSHPLGALPETLQARVGDLRARRVIIAPDAFDCAQDRAAAETALQACGCEVRVANAPDRLPDALAMVARTALGSPGAIACVPARSFSRHWGLGRWVVQVDGASFVLRRAHAARSALRAASALARALPLAFLAARRPLPGPSALDTAYAATAMRAPFPADAMSVEAVILSHNRWSSLSRTLSGLLDHPVFVQRHGPGAAARSITVVDNASADGTPDRLRQAFPQVGVLCMDRNIGVEAFNFAVARSTADAVLILDDDASPEPHALTIALDRLARRPDLGAATLHPLHPRTGLSEWPFARALGAASTDRWPVMGCANLVRTAAWHAAGGYDASFFLYRNDTDLALRLLSLGWGVHFDPALVAWHDTAGGAGSAKSPRWHRTATRNWLWLARRHGRGCHGPLGGLLGWFWAHRLAGVRLEAHLATLRGALEGLMRAPAPIAGEPDGRAWAELIRLRFGGLSRSDN